MKNITFKGQWLLPATKFHRDMAPVRLINYCKERDHRHNVMNRRSLGMWLWSHFANPFQTN